MNPSFNTSHVSINPADALALEELFTSFNTSHVSINHVGYALFHPHAPFQYISCFY